MYKRSMAVLCATVLLFGMLGWRLWSLSQSSVYSVTTQQSTRKQTVAVSRGGIYDRFGQPLVNADDQLVAVLSSDPHSIEVVHRTGDDTAEALIERLMVGERVLLPLLEDDPSLTTVTVPIRYGSDALAVHTVGYINGDGNGVCGLEKGYDDVLRAFEGEATLTYTVDALGRSSVDAVDVLDDTLSMSRGGIMTTLDTQIQQITQQLAMLYLERGAVLVSDAETGEILASVSLPLYDPSDVAKALERDDAPLLDRTLLNYNLGSVFKIITAAAALEEGLSPDTTYECSGEVTVNGVTFRCHNTDGDGVLTMHQAMACSCNVYFICLAREVGADALVAMAQKAGFDEALLCAGGVVTATPVLPTVGELYADAALANVAIGQGDLLASAVHVQALLGAVADEGIWHYPDLLIGTVDENGVIAEGENAPSVRLFSVQTADRLKTMLCDVVRVGTGMSAAPSALTAAGKTGTAQTGWVMNGGEVIQSWFGGFYPAEHPQYIVTVLSENGGANGKIASPLFAALCDALYTAGLVEKA